jgi:hypothetical protein
VPATSTALPTEIPATIEVSPTPTAVTITGAADTYIDRANPDSAAGGESTTLFVNASPAQTSFLKFDLAPLAGRTIAALTLRIKTTSDPNAGSVDSSNVKLVDNISWKEKRMSFESAVEVSEIVLGTIPTDTAPDTWYEITLDPASIQQNASNMLSLAIEATGSDELLLYSREATDQPQLVITYQ